MLYNIEAGSVGTLPCDSTGNSQLYFSEGAGHKNTARRSITIHSLSVNISECQSIDLLPGESMEPKLKDCTCLSLGWPHYGNFTKAVAS